MLRAVAILLGLASGDAFAVETMRISMGEMGERVSISAARLSFGEDAEDAAFTALQGREVSVRVEGRRLELDGAPVVGEAVRFRAGDWAQDAGVPGREPIRAGGVEVRGDVVVRLHRGRLQLINVIPLENYLVAVLGSEMPRSFPEEALKAQAVAARTYALRKKIESFGRTYHMGSSVLHQVYGGVSREDPRTRAAVEATLGEVLTFELEPIEAYFHSSCGGRTESGLDALNRDLPYLRPVKCPCSALPASHWSVTLRAAELSKAVGEVEPEALSVLSRSRTGRARRVALGAHRSLDAVSFRARVGYGKVKSLAFEVERSDEGTVHLSGRGFGHGAGMCQWGAKALADDGWDYRRILAHYYPGVELQRLY